MKKITSLLIVLVFIFSNISFAEIKPLTKFEMEVYNSVEEKNTDQNLSVLDGNYEEKRDKIYMEVAGMYGIDYSRVVDIMFNHEINAMLEEDYE